LWHSSEGKFHKLGPKLYVDENRYTFFTLEQEEMRNGSTYDLSG